MSDTFYLSVVFEENYSKDRNLGFFAHFHLERMAPFSQVPTSTCDNNANQPKSQRPLSKFTKDPAADTILEKADGDGIGEGREQSGDSTSEGLFYL